MSKIEWLGKDGITLNPIVGCTKVGLGCANCYAERFARRLAASPSERIRRQYEGVVDKHGWTGRIGVDLSVLDGIAKLRKPTTIFMVSMGDLFHENVPMAALIAVFLTMRRYREHRFIVLTKRPSMMKKFIEKEWGDVPDNVFLGVSCSDQPSVDAMVPIILSIPAAHHIISLEPMIGPVMVNRFLPCRRDNDGDGNCYVHPKCCPPGLSWVILGGETGPGARPLHPAWVRRVRDDCAAADVKFFFKGMFVDGKKTRLLDGREYNGRPRG